MRNAGERKRLKPGAVPSVFAFRQHPSAAAVARQQRAVRRQLQMEAQSMTEEEEMSFIDVGAEVEVVPYTTSDMLSSESETAVKVDHKEIQCNLPLRTTLTVDAFCDQPQAVKFYTGFKCYGQFELLFNVLGPCVNHLPINCHLVPKDQLFLTLI